MRRRFLAINRPELENLELRRLLANFLVNSTGDSNTDGTLRFAINQSNATPGQNTIQFGGLLSGEIQIAISTPLPTITNPVLIDGTTEPGYAGSPLIQIDRQATASDFDGFVVQSSSVEIRALAITNFGGAGVRINGPGSDIVDKCYIGLDLSGRRPGPNRLAGILIDNASNNLIGSTLVTTFQGNVISANIGDGVQITGINATGNTIAGNIIGLDPSATFAEGNGLITGAAQYGVRVTGAASTTLIANNIIAANPQGGISLESGTDYNVLNTNLIGTNSLNSAGLGNGIVGIVLTGSTNATLTSNVISSNEGTGVALASASNVALLLGNLIGTDSTGLAALPNQGDGISISDTSDVTIGGRLAPARNVISGNLGTGISITGLDSSRTHIQGNLIGTDRLGTTAIGNGNVGVLITGSDTNSVGSSVSGYTDPAINVISGNAFGQIIIVDGTGNLIVGNLIGTDLSGTARLLQPISATVGIRIIDAPDTTIGGVAGRANVIAGNGVGGVDIQGNSAGTLITGNYVGVAANGSLPLGNGGPGIQIGSPDVTIGGTSTASRNVVSGNLLGIVVSGSTALDEVIQGNIVGTDFSGSIAIPNASGGILIETGNPDITGPIIGPSGVTVGGTTSGAGNLVSGNGLFGIKLQGQGVSANLIEGNLIGFGLANQSLGNQGDGINLSSIASSTGLPGGAPTNNTIGGAGLFGQNVIGNNTGYGIQFETSADANVIINNLIGLNRQSFPAPNLQDGILISSSNNRVGEGNVVSGNLGNGIYLDATADHTLIVGTSIGTDVTGEFRISNGSNGIVINGASRTTIGGLSPSTRNLISGNAAYGIFAFGASSVGTQIIGNAIGTNATETNAIGNGAGGLHLGGSISATDEATAITIGGSVPRAANVISGNSGSGILLLGFNPSNGDLIAGNLIGVSTTGAALGNSGDGITALAATLGVSGVSGRNVIAGNGRFGIALIGQTASLVVNNFIGVDPTGTFARPNGQGGILLESTGNTIGGGSTDLANVISGNGSDGVLVQSSNNLIIGNLIGTDVIGRNPLRNVESGIHMNDASGNTVGGIGLLRNVISGNGANGIDLTNESTNNLIQGNLIGVDQSGQFALSNGNDGVIVEDSTNNTIGGAINGSGNIISANLGNGIHVVFSSANLTGSSQFSASIIDNVIGSNETGRLDLGNGIDGIRVEFGSVSIVENDITANGNNGISLLQGGESVVQGNVIGSLGSASGNRGVGILLDASIGNTIGGVSGLQRNIIASNANVGIYVNHHSSSTTVAGNWLGLDGQGQPGRGNLMGIAVDDSAATTIDANVVSSNSTNGIKVTNSTEINILGNVVGLDPTGNVAGPNLGDGIFLVNSPGVIVERNIVSANFGSGIQVFGLNSRGVKIDQNIIGLSGLGNVARGNAGDGILVSNAPNALVGGLTTESRNLISANLANGVEIQGANATDALIANNVIGLNAVGQEGFGNSDGVLIDGAPGARIGAVNAGNTISGNVVTGIHIVGSLATGAVIDSNVVGLGLDKLSRAANESDGVFIDNTPGVIVERTILSGNGSVGVQVLGIGSSGAIIRQNFIGTDGTGTIGVGNGRVGVFINQAPNVIVGGTDPTYRNLISGNQSVGVQIVGSLATANFVGANYIGVDVTGLKPLTNSLDGILIEAPGNTIGGTQVGARNIISANGSTGIHVVALDANYNVIQGNWIGVDATGLRSLGSGLLGVVFDRASGNLLGGLQPGAGNLITGSSDADVEIADPSSTGNVIAGNRIGTDATGLLGLSGGAIGVFINNSPRNTVGGTTPGARNIISGHALAGVQIFSRFATGNNIFGNLIGQVPTASPTLANTLGVLINNAPANQIGGLKLGQGNTISGQLSPINISGSLAIKNTVQGNLTFSSTRTVSSSTVVKKAIPHGPGRKLGL